MFSKKSKREPHLILYFAILTNQDFAKLVFKQFDSFLCISYSAWMELFLYKPFCKKIEAPIFFTALISDNQVKQFKEKARIKKLAKIKWKLLQLLNLMLLFWIKSNRWLKLYLPQNQWDEYNLVRLPECLICDK